MAHSLRLGAVRPARPREAAAGSAGFSARRTLAALPPMVRQRPAACTVATHAAAVVPPPGGPPPPLRPESEVASLSAFLDSLKFSSDGLLVAIAQHVDTGEVLMQAFADRAAVAETLQTGLATFYSRSRGKRWCKGETSGAYLRVLSAHADCDGDSLILLCDPIGPACHTGAPTCWFSAAYPVSAEGGGGISTATGPAGSARPTLLALEATVASRAAAPPPDDGAKPSWTARLLANEALLVSKVREEADELARALEDREGPERVASEAADLAYHAVVLLKAAGVPVADVLSHLRARFGVSGVVEKAGRPAKKG